MIRKSPGENLEARLLLAKGLIKRFSLGEAESAIGELFAICEKSAPDPLFLLRLRIGRAQLLSAKLHFEEAVREGVSVLKEERLLALLDKREVTGFKFELIINMKMLKH